MPRVDWERPRSVASEVVVEERRKPERERMTVERRRSTMCWTVDLDGWRVEGGSSALDSVGSVGVTGTPPGAG